MSSRVNSETSGSSSLPSSLRKKREMQICSTPINKKRLLISSVSLSEINSHSSTTASDNRTQPKRKRQVKSCLRKFRRVTRRVKETTERRGKSESEWETESEKSANDDAKNRKFSSSSSSSSSWIFNRKRKRERKKTPLSPLATNDSENNESLKLFENPEQTRDTIFIRDREELSPLRGSRIHLDNDELQEHEPQDKELLALPAVIPSVFVDDHVVETSNLSFDSSRVTKTYKPPKKPQKDTKMSVRAPWITKLRMPNDSSNMLWDAFVKKNLDLAQNQTAVSPGTSKWNVNTNTNSNLSTSLKTNLRDDHSICDLLKQQGMKRARGYCSASTRKWIDIKCNVCEQNEYENQYENFDAIEEDVKKIRFNDFHRLMSKKNAPMKNNLRDSVENQRIGASSKSDNELPCEDTSTNQNKRNPKVLSTTETGKFKFKLISSMGLDKIQFKKVNRNWEITFLQ